MNLKKYSKKQKLSVIAALTWLVGYQITNQSSLGSDSSSTADKAVFGIAFVIFILLNIAIIVFVIYVFIRGFFGRVKTTKPRSFFEAAPDEVPMNSKTWIQIIITIIIIAGVGYIAMKYFS